MTETPLYDARKRAGMTQKEAAEDWTRRWPAEPKQAKAIHYWETDARQPSVATLRRLAEVYRCRLSTLLGEEPVPEFETGIAIVTRGRDVLLVNRRETGRWQFVGGTVKPGGDPERVATREVRAEAGIEVVVRAKLGERRHPKTHTWCHYFACEYLAGDVVNADPDENTAATWAPIEKLSEFIPAEVFGPVLEHLGASRV